MNNIVLFYNYVPVLIYYDTFHQRRRFTRKVQLRGIGIRHNGGGLVSFAIYLFRLQNYQKRNSPARKPMHAFGRCPKCLR